MSEFYTLPEILYPKNHEGGEDVFFYHHIGNDSHQRTKISFSNHCITLLLSGRKKVVHGENSIFYDNTKCLLFKSGNYLSTEISPDKKPYHSLLIFFTISALDRFRHKYSEMLDESQAVEESKGYLSTRTDSFIDSYKNTVISMVDSGNLTEAMQHVKFEELMLYLTEREGGSILEFFDIPLRQDHLRTFQSVVEAHSNSNLLIEELAFLCHMSVSTFKRTFAEVYGMNPGRWFRIKRLEHAAYLMRALKKRPTEIYDEVGFSSLSSFVYSFKQKFGITPKQFQLSKVEPFSTL